MPIREIYTRKKSVFKKIRKSRNLIREKINTFKVSLKREVFHRRGPNNKTNSLHEKVLRITYSDKSSSFQELERKGNSVSIYHTNLQALATEFFEVEYIIGSKIMKGHF